MPERIIFKFSNLQINQSSDLIHPDSYLRNEIIRFSNTAIDNCDIAFLFQEREYTIIFLALLQEVFSVFGFFDFVEGLLLIGTFRQAVMNTLKRLQFESD